jgi:hypothetical protein
LLSVVDASGELDAVTARILGSLSRDAAVVD